MLKAKQHSNELMVSNDDICQDSPRVLCQDLVDSTCQLEVLMLENCGLTLTNGKDLCGIMASKALLQKLHLGDKLSDLGIAQLCLRLLYPSSWLRGLWCWDYDITTKGCRDLCYILRTKVNLKS